MNTSSLHPHTATEPLNDVFSVRVENGFRCLFLPDVLSSRGFRASFVLRFSVYRSVSFSFLHATGAQTEKQPFRSSDYVHNKFVRTMRLKNFGISPESRAGGGKEFCENRTVCSIKIPRLFVHGACSRTSQ